MHRTSTSTRSRARFLVLAPVALVVAMGSSATAAALITGAQIQDGSVAGRDITDRSLTGVDVKDKSLTPADFTGSVQGPAGPAGPAGPQGPQGPAGVGGVQYAISDLLITGGTTRTWGAFCPAGTKVLGGGVSSPAPSQARVVESAPMDNGVGWGVGLRNEGGTMPAYAWAVCANA